MPSLTLASHPGFPSKRNVQGKTKTGTASLSSGTSTIHLNTVILSGHTLGHSGMPPQECSGVIPGEHQSKANQTIVVKTYRQGVSRKTIKNTRNKCWHQDSKFRIHQQNNVDTGGFSRKQSSPVLRKNSLVRILLKDRGRSFSILLLCN